MEHKLIQGGEQFLPFARSRIKALKAAGLKYASQKFEIDGVSIRVRIAGEHEYIELGGGKSSGLYLIFAELPSATTGQAAALQYGAATGGNVCAVLNQKLINYFCLGTEAPSPKKFKAIPLDAYVPDISRQSTLFRLLSFYDGLPVKFKRQVLSPAVTILEEQTPIFTSTPGADPNNPDNWDSSGAYRVVQEVSTTNTDVLHGSKTFSHGSYVDAGTEKRETRMAANITLVETGFVFSGSGSSTASGFVSTLWAGWNMVATRSTTGSESSTFVAPDTFTSSGAIPPPAFAAASLGLPKKPKNKDVVDLAEVPAYIDINTPRDYFSADVAANPPGKPEATPINRHLLDFYFLKNRVNLSDVRSVCKQTVYCWTSLGGYSVNVPIKAINFLTGATWEINAPQLFDPEFEVVSGQAVIPPDYTPRYVVFYDNHIARVTNDPATAHFWLYVYESAVSAYTTDLATGLSTNIKLISCTTNKPGDLGPGHENTKQVVIKNHPTKSYLIGAMRDELACM